MTPKKFLAAVFRLSLVAGLTYAAFDSFSRLSAYTDAIADYELATRRMDCVKQIGDDWLTQNQNEFGNIDVTEKCGPRQDGDAFFTNLSEVKRVRDGEDLYSFMLWRKPFYFNFAAIAFLQVFIGLNLLGLLLVGLYKVGRWIAYGRSG